MTYYRLICDNGNIQRKKNRRDAEKKKRKPQRSQRKHKEHKEEKRMIQRKKGITVEIGSSRYV